MTDFFIIFVKNFKMKIEKAFIDSIPSDSLKDLSSDYSELLLDSLLNDGILKEIPVFGTLFKIFKVGSGIKDYMFSKKILIFLSKLNEVSLEKREQFYNKIENDPKIKQKLGENILLLLEKQNDYVKAKLLANSFNAFIREEISYNRFMDLAYAIDAVKVHYLAEIVFIVKKKWHPSLLS